MSDFRLFMCGVSALRLSGSHVSLGIILSLVTSDLGMWRVGGVFLSGRGVVAVVLMAGVHVVPLVSQLLGGFRPLGGVPPMVVHVSAFGSRQHLRVVPSRQRLLSSMTLFVPYVSALSGLDSCGGGLVNGGALHKSFLL
ncbi:hypothetical protein L484_007362 [Morus notabilis]|uniref:Uncharacterized protein n=1 Tax=Morus notabilis TaxID=981085 RepID=W9QQ88_9ROSA|nr:hypothetical protein L484_007362 [Morus notabilis]